jgi:hypothetical protein
MQQHATITEATFIADADLKLTAKPRGRPIHKILVSFPLLISPARSSPILTIGGFPMCFGNDFRSG